MKAEKMLLKGDLVRYKRGPTFGVFEVSGIWSEGGFELYTLDGVQGVFKRDELTLYDEPLEDVSSGSKSLKRSVNTREPYQDIPETDNEGTVDPSYEKMFGRITSDGEIVDDESEIKPEMGWFKAHSDRVNQGYHSQPARRNGYTDYERPSYYGVKKKEETADFASLLADEIAEKVKEDKKE